MLIDMITFDLLSIFILHFNLHIYIKSQFDQDQDNRIIIAHLPISLIHSPLYFRNISSFPRFRSVNSHPDFLSSEQQPNRTPKNLPRFSELIIEY